MKTPPGIESAIKQHKANYIIFSDVHLGSDLVQHARPWTVGRLRRMLQIDRDLATMLDYYCRHADRERPWCLVIAGDLVDFVGMAIAPKPDAALQTPLTEEEKTHGLGSSRDHAEAKMRVVAQRHALVFCKLAQFVAQGHSLILIRGNHDVEFHWRKARRAFVQALMERAEGLSDRPAARHDYERRIEFHPWFYYVKGLLYVEHGHQYDEACSYHHVLNPVSPKDPHRISWSLSDILLRYVARPFPGVGAEGHDNNSILDYVRLATSMGGRRCLRLGSRFSAAIVHTFKEWQAHRHPHKARVRAKHERKLRRLARRLGLPEERMLALSALAAPPITGRFLGIVRSLFLDGVIAFGIVVGGLGIVGFLGLAPWPYLPALSTALAVGLYVWMQQVRVADAAAGLREGAQRIAELMPARYIVMGHTHSPAVETLADGVTYVNVGSWGVDELDGGERAAPRTHLVIRHVDGKPHAQFYAWDPATGPLPVNLSR
ncbi:MAG: metallophosphoesterase [Proteobacteria bacterium]|nr:metallophosphoesterase [Pseudomonadota bacterium]